MEQLAGLRAIPGLTVIRPADANETAEAWKFAVQHNGPTLFALTARIFLIWIAALPKMLTSQRALTFCRSQKAVHRT